jgi:hypothetical protein
MQCYLPSPSLSYTMMQQESSSFIVRPSQQQHHENMVMRNADSSIVATTTVLHTKQASRKRPRVDFSEARVVGIVANRSDLSKEDTSRIWYPTAELDQFKTEARALCRSLREQQKEHDVDVPRGLEQRVCCQRQRHRYLAVRCVLKAQQRSRCSDFVGMVAHKCNRWAADIAQLEAQHDFVDVYKPSLKRMLPQVKDLPMYDLPIQAKKRDHNQVAAEQTSCDCASDDSSDDNDSVHAAQRSVRARKA